VIWLQGRPLIHDGQVAILRPGTPADKAAVWPDECDCGCAQPAYPAVSLPPLPPNWPPRWPLAATACRAVHPAGG